MLYSIVSVLVIIADQAMKNWIANTLPGADVVRFIPGVVSLVNVHNDGAAFSFLAGGGARIYFIIITGVFTVAVIIALATNFISGRLSRWSLVLITAGGLSNCIDRIIYGYVQDMFKVELFDFAIFNIADIFITVFALVFVLAMIFERQEDDEDEYYDEEEEEDKGKKKPKKHRGVPLLNRFKRDDSLDEDDGDSDMAPRERGKNRKSRKPDYEAEYEQYKAQRAAREQSQSRQPAGPSVRPATDDPFAEWERANAKLGSQPLSGFGPRSDSGAAAQRQPVRQAPTQPSAPVRAAAPTRTAAPAAPVSREVSAPRQPDPDYPQPAAPARRPEQSKPAASGSGDFDLDDILAEFK